MLNTFQGSPVKLGPSVQSANALAENLAMAKWQLIVNSRNPLIFRHINEEHKSYRVKKYYTMPDYVLCERHMHCTMYLCQHVLKSLRMYAHM
jgi:hypothetical protein